MSDGMSLTVIELAAPLSVRITVSVVGTLATTGSASSESTTATSAAFTDAPAGSVGASAADDVWLPPCVDEVGVVPDLVETSAFAASERRLGFLGTSAAEHCSVRRTM